MSVTPAVSSGVYPCWKEQFQIQIPGSGSTPTFVPIADCESFSVSFDNGVEEWTPFSSEGWTRRLMTAKSVTVSVTAKRNVGDDGNDAVAAMALASGADAQATFKWTFADGDSITFTDAVVNVTALGAGDATGVAPLEFEIMSNGKLSFDA